MTIYERVRKDFLPSIQKRIEDKNSVPIFVIAVTKEDLESEHLTGLETYCISGMEKHYKDLLELLWKRLKKDS